MAEYALDANTRLLAEAMGNAVGDVDDKATEARAAAVPRASYTDAFDDANLSPQTRISAFVAGRLTEWIRRDGGPCLGGGWVPAGTTTPQHFGAVGAGLTDDRAAIQAACDWADEVHIVGPHRVMASTYDATADWSRHIVLTKPTKIVFNGGYIQTTTPFAGRATGILVRSSDCEIVGADWRDTNTAGSCWIIPVAAGTAYDSSFPNAVLSGLKVTGGTFRNAWLAVSVQFVASGVAGAGFRGVKVSNAESYAKADTGSAGNFNFRSDPPWRVGDVQCIGCSAYDGKTASSYNYYGVDGGSVIGCSSHRNMYAGTEMENGTQDVTITGFVSVDDLWGVWIDDSRRITVTGLTHKTLTEDLVTPLMGTYSRLRSAVNITRQGFAAYPNWKTEGIVIQGVVSEFGRITVGTFGTEPGGEFGDITIDGVSIHWDGVARSNGNAMVQIGGTCPDFSLSRARLRGATTRAVELSIPANGRHRLKNVKTFQVGSETPVGLLTAGAGTLSVDDVEIPSDSLGNSGGTDLRNYRIGGIRQPDRIGGLLFEYGGLVSPEGRLSAPVGSWSYTTAGGFYKATGTGNTGWVAK